MKIAACALPLLALPLLPPQELAVQAREGRALTRTYSYAQELRVEEMHVELDGETLPADGTKQVTTRTYELVVRDVVRRVEDGRVTELERTYEELAREDALSRSHPQVGDHERRTQEGSRLQGERVRFKDEEGVLVPGFGGDGGDEELLEGLRADLELGVLVPGEEVAEGATWSVDLELLELLAQPCGDLHFRPTDGEAAPAPNEAPPQPERTGTIEATFKGTREVDGRSLAVVALAVDVRTEVDLTEYTRLLRPEEDEMGMPVPEIGSLTEKVEYDGEAECLWDLAGGRLHSLKWECDLRRVQDIEMTMELPGGARDVVQKIVQAGDESLEVRFEE